jgi:MiaB/RimO family radical SAM methylthiotransferase
MNSVYFKEVSSEADADVVLTNTCAIREGAEAKVWQRLRTLRSEDDKSNLGVPRASRNDRIIGVLGCMAERLKKDILEDDKTDVDLVVGPDAYRELPGILEEHWMAKGGGGCVRTDSTKLSFTETYSGVRPVLSGEVAEHVSVMRGCNNMCSYCVVPFTRGRERSRDLEGIVEEVRYMVGEGVKEITLLGQNVNSYHDKSEGAVLKKPAGEYGVSNSGFQNMYNLRGGGGFYFADLVDAVSRVDDEVRVRFTSPHPKDYPRALIELMAERENVCSQLHMPAQSGSDGVLERMRRGYGREGYMRLIEDAKDTIRGVSISR